MGGWKLWLAIAFVLGALALSAPFLPRWLWILCSITVIGIGLVLVSAAIKRKSAKTIESVGLLPSVPEVPPTDFDGP